jgi:hypothetical protein
MHRNEVESLFVLWSCAFVLAVKHLLKGHVRDFSTINIAASGGTRSCVMYIKGCHQAGCCVRSRQ